MSLPALPALFLHNGLFQQSSWSSCLPWLNSKTQAPPSEAETATARCDPAGNGSQQDLQSCRCHPAAVHALRPQTIVHGSLVGWRQTQLIRGLVYSSSRQWCRVSLITQRLVSLLTHLVDATVACLQLQIYWVLSADLSQLHFPLQPPLSLPTRCLSSACVQSTTSCTSVVALDTAAPRCPVLGIS